MIRRATDLLGERRVNEPSFSYSTTRTRDSSCNPQGTWKASYWQAFASVVRQTRTWVLGAGI